MSAKEQKKIVYYIGSMMVIVAQNVEEISKIWQEQCT